MSELPYYLPYGDRNLYINFDSDAYTTISSDEYFSVVLKLFLIAMITQYKEYAPDLVPLLKLPKIQNQEDKELCTYESLLDILTVDCCDTFLENGYTIFYSLANWLDFNTSIVDYFDDEVSKLPYEFQDVVNHAKLADISGDGLLSVCIFSSKMLGTYFTCENRTQSPFNEEIDMLVNCISECYVTSIFHIHCAVGDDGIYRSVFLTGKTDTEDCGIYNIDLYLPLYCHRLSKILPIAMQELGLEVHL